MTRIITQTSQTAQWQELVREAGELNRQPLDEELESYLVFLLMRHLDQVSLADRLMAIEYLRATRETGASGKQQLRDVGDQCLLYSGFFPKRSRSRLVKISYYVDIGRSAYTCLAEQLKSSSEKLYQRLAEQFVLLMDILQAIRAMNTEGYMDSNLLLEYADECNSAHATKILKQSDILLFPKK